MDKLNIFLIGLGVVAVVSMLFDSVGLGGWVAGLGVAGLAYIVFYLPK